MEILKKDLISKKKDHVLIKKKPSWKEFIPSMIYWPVIIAQLIFVFFYYNYYNLNFLTWIGWGFLICFIIFGDLPKQAFKKYGEIEAGKNHIYTTKLVDRGIYSIIRHPYWLCWIVLSISFSLMSQHEVMIVLSMIACPIIYFETFNLDKGLIKKFGEDYSQYKKRVPRMNLLLGFIKYVKRNKKNSTI